MITSPQPSGPTDVCLLPCYGVHKDDSERVPSIMECSIKKKTLEDITRLKIMSSKLYRELPNTSLGID